MAPAGSIVLSIGDNELRAACSAALAGQEEEAVSLIQSWRCASVPYFAAAVGAIRTWLAHRDEMLPESIRFRIYWEVLGPHLAHWQVELVMVLQGDRAGEWLQKLISNRPSEQEAGTFLRDEQHGMSPQDFLIAYERLESGAAQLRAAPDGYLVILASRAADE